MLNPMKGFKDLLRKVVIEVLENATLEISMDESGEKKAVLKFHKEV